MSGEEKFGFRIVSNDRVEDFYCEDEEDQERWLIFLQ
jgi:hypothetical protein